MIVFFPRGDLDDETAYEVIDSDDRIFVSVFGRIVFNFFTFKGILSPSVSVKTIKAV